MSIASIKCGCVVRDRHTTVPQNELFTCYPCLQFDVGFTDQYLNYLLGFSYRGQSIADIADEIHKCANYVAFHLTHDSKTLHKSYPDSVLKRLYSDFSIPLEQLSFMFKAEELWNARLNAILSDLDGYDFCISPAELLELNGMSVNQLNFAIKKLNIDQQFEDSSKLYNTLSDSLVYDIQQSKHWLNYNESKPYFDSPQFPLAIKKVEMAVHQQKNWVFNKVRHWFTSEIELIKWFNEKPIAGLGHRTPHEILDEGKFDALKHHLLAIELGGYE